MKHILFVVIALTGSFNAFARYSPADCREALVAHVWTGQKFNKVKRLDGALDGASDATLLLRKEGTDEIIVPKDAGLTHYTDQKFYSKGEGATFTLVHGSAQDLIAARHRLIFENKGQKLSYQVVDRDQVRDVKPRLNIELERRGIVPSSIKAKFLKLDSYLARFRAYIGFKKYMSKNTAPLRDGLAARLHRWRNPTTNVAPYVLSEVRSCTDSTCAREPAPVDLIQERLEMFSRDVGMGLKLDHAGSLSPLVIDLLSVLKPVDVDAHEAAVSEAGLGDWDPLTMTRHKRLLALEKAWALIESALRGETVKPAAITVGAIDEGSVRFREMISAPLAPRTVTMAEWSHGAIESELFDARFRALRGRRPYSVVRNDRDVRIVAFDPDWIFTGKEISIFDEIGQAGGGVVGAVARAYLNGGSEPVRLTAAEARDTRRLRELAERQQVAVINGDSRDHSIWLVPLKLDADFHYDSSVARATNLRLKPLNDFVVAELDRAGVKAGPQPMTYVNPNGGGVVSFEATLFENATGRDQIHIQNLRAVEVSAEGDNVEEAPIDDFADLVIRTHERAPMSIRGTQHIVLEQSERAWHFDFTMVRSDDVDQIKISKISPMLTKSASGFWTRIAKERNTKAFDETWTETPGFQLGNDKIFRVQMSPLVVEKAATLYGLSAVEIHEVLMRAHDAEIDPKTSCAIVEDVQFCFGPQGGTWARVAEVRRAPRALAKGQ